MHYEMKANIDWKSVINEWAEGVLDGGGSETVAAAAVAFSCPCVERLKRLIGFYINTPIH